MSDYIVGRNAVLEHLKAGKDVEKVYVQKGELKGSIHKITGIAHDRGIVVVECDKHKLDEMSGGLNHQGVAILAVDYQFSTIDEMLALAKEKGEDPFLILLDEISDPQNLGAIIRTAEAAGAHGVVIPKRRSATITAAVHRTSAGATSTMKVAKVTNMNTTIEALKKENIWVYGAAGEAKATYWQTNFKGGVALVIGNEGKGISKLTRERCDALVSIPMLGQVESLNASASAAILIYEVVRTRMQGKAEKAQEK